MLWYHYHRFGSSSIKSWRERERWRALMLPMGDTHSNVFWHTFINIIVCFQKKGRETRMINLTIYIRDDYRRDCCERPMNVQNVFISQTSDDEKTDRQNTYIVRRWGTLCMQKTLIGSGAAKLLIVRSHTLRVFIHSS